MKQLLSIIMIFVMISGIIPLMTSAATDCTVADNVIDITDKTVYSLASFYAKATNIKITGAAVESASEDGTYVDIVLDGATASDAEIGVEFGTALNRCTMSGHSGKVILEDGMAEYTITLTGQYSSSRKGSVTYTLNFSLGAPPTEPPALIKYTDSISTYCGVDVVLNLKDYFTGAKTYYLFEGEEKTPVDGSTYTFRTFTGGTHTLVFAASNVNGDCPDYVTVNVEVTEIKSGAWLGITTSNGSVNYVKFADAEGVEIDGLTAYSDGTSIMVGIPRTYAADGKITATFDLTQKDGYPKLSTSNRFNGTNDSKVYTTTLSSGVGSAVMYLYNTAPKATSNNYTTYTINYAIANEVPVLAEGQQDSITAHITADKTYSLDLDGIFVDSDEADTITGWKVSVDGAAAVDAVVDENNVYRYQTNDAGEHILEFYGMDNYNALSSEKYTVTLAVDNAETTYDVTATVIGSDSVPVFYYSKDAKEGTELTSTAKGSIYTVKVPTNISMISWRADGVGMNAPVSHENNNIILIKPAFVVKADEAVDENALVTVTHSALNVVGSENNYLLLRGEKYNLTATPSADYETSRKNGSLEDYTVSTSLIEINLVTKGIIFTFPYFAQLTVSEASTVQGIAPKAVSPVKTTETDFASGIRTATYELTNGKVYEYRVSVPEENVNCDKYVTYVATFTKADATGIAITKEQIEAGDKGRTTIDRDVSSNRGRNVADLYTNVNAKGYKNLNVGDEFKLIATRNYWGINADWLMNKNYFYIEPEFHYAVVDENGQANSSVITIDDNGNIKAVGEGTAIVMITYDAMTLNHEPKLSEGALGDYTSTPNDFYGAIWPENTGVFVVSVGSDDSGITTGMTINEDKTTSQKASGKNIDAELDVIYFIGENGKYTFTPATEGVSVWVASPTVSDKMSFTGFKAVSANEDGSVTVPLTTGRNIVKLVKDGKAEYQVITAKGVNVTVNGNPLETAVVAPGQKVSIEFDNLFAPANRMAIYNTASAVVYTEISGWEGKKAGNARGSMGEYIFSSNPAKRTVENFVSASTDNSGYSNSQVTSEGELTVPEDYEGEYFTLSNGSFNIGGFMPYLLGSHYEKLGVIPPNSTTSDNINCYLGIVPDISIPIGEGNSDEDIEGDTGGDSGEDDSGDNGGSTGGNDGGSTLDKYNSIDVYMTFVNRDNIVVQNKKIMVYDKDKDGKYVIGDAFRALHREHYSGGESGYKEISGNGISGWVSKFWGTSDATFTYALNYSWTKSTEDAIEDGDNIAALIGKDSEFYSDLFTWFDNESYSAKVNADVTLKVNGLNLMASSAAHNALHTPCGATVTVYDKSGKEIKDMATVVDKDGRFTLSFSASGAYTVKVSGKAKWGSYDDAPVAPSTCKVSVNSAGGSSASGKNTNTKSEDCTSKDENEDISEPKNEFTDAKAHWGESYIAFVTGRGLYNGIGDGKFGVDSTMTRAMLVTVLHRLAGTPEAEANHDFDDVKADKWYSDAVLWASANGIVNGNTHNSFNPEGTVTREQVATMLYRYVKKLDMQSDVKSDISTFGDCEKVSSWSEEAITWAIAEGIITGKPNSILDPQGTATRTEVAAMFMRLITLVIE